MRFLPDGPDIPGELIAAQEKGEVIFICGAGVSKTIDLPDFRELVQRVYLDLGEDWNPYPAEREVMEGIGSMARQYDRGLRALERRLVGANHLQARGMRKRLREAVTRAVSVPEGDYDLSNHAALIELSRDDVGNFRLVTTNFDTLFERAWVHGEAPSFAGAAMPQPKTAECRGILHLHGRIADDVLGLEETALVLTSAEFGDAYLKSGWASRYVYDLARAYVVVLVGYSADDPPMRYLLEVLESDRERYPDLRKVYAFAAHDEGDDAVQQALWHAKGAEPILHPGGDDGFRQLYATIRAWRDYAASPTDWRREQLRACFEKSAAESNADERAKALSYLGHGDAERLITELSPSPDWLSLFDKNKVFADGRSSPGRWIGANVDNPEMIRACIDLPSFDNFTLWHLQRGLEQATDISGARKWAWQIIVEAKRGPRDEPIGGVWHGEVDSIRAGRSDYSARRLICEMVRPRLQIRRPFTFFDEETTDRPESLYTLVDVDFDAAGHIPASEILDAWPRTDVAEVSLLAMLERTLLDSLEFAESVGFVTDWDRADQDVPSVAAHQQNQNRTGFYSIIRLVADLWQRLSTYDPETARTFANRWSASSFVLFRRLALFAFAAPCFPADEGADAVLAMDDGNFWSSGAPVEIMRFLTARWQEITPETRARIEGRLAAGIPMEQFIRPSHRSEEDLKEISDYAAFRRLKRLERSGAILTDQSQAVLEAITAQHPGWVAEAGDRDDFSSWHESSSGPDGHAELLADTDDNLVVEEAMRIQAERRMDEGDLWRVFCSANPQRALRGLRLKADAGDWDESTWREFFWEATEREDRSLQAEVTGAVLDMPDETLRALLGTITSWQRRKRKLIWLGADGEDAGRTFFAIWDRCAILTYGPNPVEGKIDYDDIRNRSLNDPGGELVWSLLEALEDSGVQQGAGLPDAYRERLDLAVATDSFQGLLARYQCAQHLSFLNHFAPDWVQVSIVPLFDRGRTEAKYMWSALANDRLPTVDLFNRLKPNFLIAASRTDIPEHDLIGLVIQLFDIAVLRQLGRGDGYDLNPMELRRILGLARTGVREKIAWRLWRLVDYEVPVHERPERWRTVVGPLFASIWPLDSRLRTPAISQSLTLMALASGDAFPEAVEAIASTLVPFNLYTVKSSLRFEDRDKVDPLLFPAALLKILDCLVDPAFFTAPKDLAEVLEQIVTADASLALTAAYRRLLAIARASDA